MAQAPGQPRNPGSVLSSRDTPYTCRTADEVRRDNSQRQVERRRKVLFTTRAEDGPSVTRTSRPPALPDNGQLGEGHGRQAEAVWEGDELHRPRALGRVALQALRHVFLF